MPARSVILGAFCAGLLATAPYDISAVPDAAAARERTLISCQMRTFATVTAQVECGLAAYRQYAVIEKLQPMSLFREYADGARKAAQATDQGKLSAADLQTRLAKLRSDYEGAIAKRYSDYKTARPRVGPPFDRAGWGRGSAKRDHAVTACLSANPNLQIDCFLRAEKAFTTDVGLKDMDLFYGYASFLRVDEVDAEMGRFGRSQLAVRHEKLWSDFLRTLNQDYSNWAKGTKEAAHGR